MKFKLEYIKLDIERIIGLIVLWVFTTLLAIIISYIKIATYINSGEEVIVSLFWRFPLFYMTLWSIVWLGPLSILLVVDNLVENYRAFKELYD